jgi:hypothetical protein
MSSKTAILTSKAPKPLPGIYSQAIVANGFVYCSGAIAMDPSGKIIDGDIAAHTVNPPTPSASPSVASLTHIIASMHQKPHCSSGRSRHYY